MDRINKSYNTLEIIRNERNLPAGVFCLLWLGLWTFGLITICKDVFFKEEFYVIEWLWIIIMALVWIWVGFGTLRALFGKEILFIVDEKLTICKMAVFVFYRRQIPITSIKNIDIVQKDPDKEKEQYCLKFSAARKDLFFAVGIDTATLHEWLKEIRDFIEDQYELTLPPAESTASIKSQTSFERYITDQAKEEKEEQKKGLADKAISRLEALVFVAFGIIWNIAIIGGIIQAIKDRQWFTLIILIPFMIVGLFLAVVVAVVVYACVRGFIEETVDVLKSNKRRGREPGYTARVTDMETGRERLLPPRLSRCILLEDKLEYRGELNIEKEDELLYLVFSTCLDKNDEITDYIKIPVREITAVVQQGILLKKTIIRTIMDREYVFSGLSKTAARVIYAYYSRA